MKVLGIETSCDDTAAAVVEDGRLLSSVFASQTAVHGPFGGVVPELASRSHLTSLPATIDAALEKANTRLDQIDAVAATYGPGLIGALLVGVSTAKALAFALDRPFLGANHLQAHVAAALLEAPDLQPPFLGLVVSGGHTLLVEVRAWDSFRLLGRTVDDAAGEVLDKIARLMGLGYPGGRAIEEQARSGKRDAITLPRPSVSGPLDFSFAGLKTAAARVWRGESIRGARRSTRAGSRSVASPRDLAAREDGEPVDAARGVSIPDLAAALQEAVVEVLAQRLDAALELTGLAAAVLAGGVAANGPLRAQCEAVARARGVRLVVPRPALCTDNAAMVACLASRRLVGGQRSPLDLGPDPTLSIETN